MDVLIFVVVFVGGGILLASFVGGVASAIAEGGREDNSILTNAGVGFIGWLVAGIIWSAVQGTWPEELTIGFILLVVGCSIVVALFRVMRRRRAAETQSGSARSEG